LDCDRDSGIDLHIHSTASDGTFSPSEILQLALDVPLRAISITDHDTIDGVREAMAFGIPQCLRFVSGVEISASPPEGIPAAGSLHILGYGFDPDNAPLAEILTYLQAARKERNPGILARLQALGFELTMKDIPGSETKGQIGRPHIARAMVEKGYAQSIDDAFDRYLGNGKPAYVDKARIPCETAIQILRDAGGVPVLAHPFLLRRLDPSDLERLVAEMVRMGLVGIEVYYPDHSDQAVRQGLALAQRYSLLVTGGTDFHGDVKPEVRMGVGTGDLFVPYSLFEALEKAIAERR
jgi:predicted metal-dependent phosphoesterase TrpH